MISSNDISIIVQGAINDKETPQCLTSIRKYLPGAEIILSTWEGEDTTGLDYDILIQNKAPGAVFMDINGRKIYNNLNRQLYSTQQGLKHAGRKYALKLRSDLILTSPQFLEYFDQFQERTENYRLFKHKILTDVFFSRYKIKTGKHYTIIPFHVSDWWFFGLKEDLDTYFLQTPLVIEPEFTDYFNLNPDKTGTFGLATFKFAPEQYFCYSCFARNFDDIYMKDCSDINDTISQKSREAIINNFIILGYEQSGIYLNKYPCSKHPQAHEFVGMYNFYKYQSEYKEFCDSSYKISTPKPVYEDENAGFAKLRIQKHLTKLKSPSTPLVRKFEELFISLPVSVFLYIYKLLKSCFTHNNDTN